MKKKNITLICALAMVMTLTAYGSTWNLTGNCVISSLTNNGTINFNGYTVTLADETVLSE